MVRDTPAYERNEISPSVSTFIRLFRHFRGTSRWETIWHWQEKHYARAPHETKQLQSRVRENWWFFIPDTQFCELTGAWCSQFHCKIWFSTNRRGVLRGGGGRTRLAVGTARNVGRAPINP